MGCIEYGRTVVRASSDYQMDFGQGRQKGTNGRRLQPRQRLVVFVFEETPRGHRTKARKYADFESDGHFIRKIKKVVTEGHDLGEN